MDWSEGAKPKKAVSRKDFCFKPESEGSYTV